MTIETYAEMNAKIVELLRLYGERHLTLYAAQRIEELEAEVKQLQSEIEALKGCDATIALLSHQMRATCEQAGLGADHALYDYVPLLGNEIVLLKRREKERAYNDDDATP